MMTWVGNHKEQLPTVLGPPQLEQVQICRIGRQVQAAGWVAGADPFGDEVLVGSHFGGLGGEFLGEMGRQHDHSVAIAGNDVAGKHRGIAALGR
jgi:hypothetical protein